MNDNYQFPGEHVHSAFVGMLARCLVLGTLLDAISRRYEKYNILAHWTQGEFHHDLILVLPEKAVADIGGQYLLVATNCNGGIKEVMSFKDAPDRMSLWHTRCPNNPEFTGETVTPVAHAVTEHWFDPCDLLKDNARSEIRPEYRVRQEGGGWQQADGPSCAIKKI